VELGSQEFSPDSSGFALEAAEIVAKNAHDRNDKENISAAKPVTVVLICLCALWFVYGNC